MFTTKTSLGIMQKMIAIFARETRLCNAQNRVLMEFGTTRTNLLARVAQIEKSVQRLSSVQFPEFPNKTRLTATTQE
jgi:hypothetical protein